MSRRLLTLSFLCIVLPLQLSARGSRRGNGTPWTWERHPGNPILTPNDVSGKRGGFYPFVADASVMWDEGRFKMWFNHGGVDDPSDESTIRVRIGYAESEDGRSWKVVSVPALDVGEPGAWDSTNAEVPSVIKDESLPEGHPWKYRIYYGGLDANLERSGKLLEVGMGYGIGVAFSSDGKKFIRLAASDSPYGVPGLVLKPNPFPGDKDGCDLVHVTDPDVIRAKGSYHLWYTSLCRRAKKDETYLAIAYATSADGVNWTKHGVVLEAEDPWEKRGKDVNVGRPSVLLNGERFEMFYDAVKDDDNPLKNTAAAIGFAWSEDGKSWRREPWPALTSDHGTAERKGIIVGAEAVLKDNAYYLFYPGADPEWDRFVLNLAVGRRN